MLSRIGNSLFWMGRYVERAEHIARYMKVQYTSMLDAPIVQSKDFVLESILNMGGMNSGYYHKHQQLQEDDVVDYVTLDEENPYSILSCIGSIRENARGARDVISTEMWEAINRFYHGMNDYTTKKLHNEGVFRFSQKVEENAYIIKGYIDNTLVRSEVWRLIMLGIHLERAIQVALILRTKVKDIAKIEPSKLGGPLEFFQWATLLKCAEAFDMHKRYYTSRPSRTNTLEFLIFSTAFPKSLAYNLSIVLKLVQEIGFHEQKGKGSIDFMAGKVATQFQYQTIEDVDGTMEVFLEKTISELFGLAQLLQSKYLSF